MRSRTWIHHLVEQGLFAFTVTVSGVYMAKSFAGWDGGGVTLRKAFFMYPI